MAKIPVYVLVSDTNQAECDAVCPFLQDDKCLLFKAELGSKALQSGRAWNDCAPTRMRCDECLCL